MNKHKFVSKQGVCNAPAASMPFIRRAGLTAIVSCLAGSASAAVVLGSQNGWETSVSGSIPVFLVNGDVDNGEDFSRIQSGFNPAQMTFVTKAPETDGITMSGRVQIDTHLQGSQTQNSGAFESRVAELQLDGSFGTVNIGKGFGIFNSSAIGDIGSQTGVGLLSGSAADHANTTSGHIGTGYVYANFNPRIMFTTRDMDGLKIKVGLFNPEEPAGVAAETSLPRVEGQLDYAIPMDNGGLKFWTGFMRQEVELTAVDFDYTIQGFDVGTHLDLGGFGLTLAYTDTKGIGADGLYGFGGINDAEVDATQWYAEADYQFGKTTLGISYGEGEQDATVTAVGAAPEVKNELGMLFVHHKLLPSLTLVAEIQGYQSDAAPGDYNALVLGAQFDF